MFTTTITFKDALALLVAIVKDFGPEHRAQNPDGTTGCTYFVFDEATDVWGVASKRLDHTNLRAVCLIGQVFQRLGISRALLSGEGEQHSTCTPGYAMWSNAAQMGVVFTADAQALLRAAQERQDSGKTWAEAVPAAVDNVQQAVLDEFKQNSDRFGHDVTNLVAEVPKVTADDGLAEWERELLYG